MNHSSFGRAISSLLLVVATVISLALTPGEARVVGVEANSLSVSCSGALSVTPSAYKPGSGGVLAATLRAPCYGSGYAYNFIQISVERYALKGGALKSLKYKNCYHVPACTMTYPFAGGPDRYEVFAFVWWNSTNGPWQLATPGIVVSAAPACFGIDTGEWPVTPIGAASQIVGCNLLADAVF
jgi:hypothetical protein